MEMICQGLPASWVNGWLAAVGATFLDSRLRLHWTEGGNLAVLSAADCDPVDALVESWPKRVLLDDLPIVANNWKNAGELPRKATVDLFKQRVQAARSHSHSWTLSSTVTDLKVYRSGEVAHAPFAPPVQGKRTPAGKLGGGWVLHDLLLKTHEHTMEHLAECIRDSLAGKARRVQGNGLGFDQTRLGSQADTTDPWINPVVEVMAFFGLALLPMRGDGVDDRLPPIKASGDGGQQRGWRRPSKPKASRRFHWPAWGHPLDFDGIDALLDVWNPYKKERRLPFGVHAAWRSVRYETDGSDCTRAYGSERL